MTRSPAAWRTVLEISIVFALLLAAIWTRQGGLNELISIAATGCIVAFAIAGKWSPSELGLTRPVAGVVPTIVTGAALCLLIALSGFALRFAGHGYRVPLGRSWLYAVWALEQQFILQGIFFVRLEALLGARSAIATTAFLFALAHLPNPVLTPLAFCGALVFCEIFRRWRNLYPLGVIHAALGLTIATSLPDRWLHHMRVGIGYLLSH